jgi:hypothetical protein
MLKLRIGKHNDRNMDTIHNVTLPVYLNNIDRFTLYVVICKETSSVEIFSPIDQVPMPCTDVSRVGQPLFILTLYFNTVYVNCMC